MAGKIFINYRRGDDPGNTGRLFDRLQETFAPEQLFMDVDSIAPGLDFVVVLEDQVAQCDVLLAVIGKGWIDALDPAGARRLDNPDDFVRIEIASALNQGKRVIPVLVSEARMPRPDELPEAIRPLARRHAVRLTHERFRADAQGLVKALQQALEEVDALRRAQAEAARKAQAEEERKRAEATAIERAEARRLQRLQSQQVWRPSRLALLIGGAVVVGAAGIWVVFGLPTSVQMSDAGRADKAATAAEAEAKRRRAEEEMRRDPLAVMRGSGQSFRDHLASGQPCPICPEMVVVPAGSFMMGSPENEPGRIAEESPQHPVTFARPFAVGRFALTFDEWDGCVADGGCNAWKPADQWGRGRQPVINVSWDDAKAYVVWLSSKIGKPYRLLTEAEREYITRAGTTTPFWWGSSISTSQANYNGNYTYGGGVKGEFRQRTLPVDSFPPNPWGLFQVHGNVWEWVEDCYRESYVGAPSDGSAWTSDVCASRVVRGGSWRNYPHVLRSAFRVGYTTGYRNYFLGFRVGRTLTP
jgi:formylglycine-generating enzyme required for sulfatase activity